MLGKRRIHFSGAGRRAEPEAGRRAEPEAGAPDRLEEWGGPHTAPQNTAMSVTAKQLSKSGARGKDIDNLIREQIHLIDDRLLRAERTWGRNVVAHDLPTMFGVPGLDKKDAQRIVYSAIIRSYDKRGFETRLLLETERSTLFLAWMTDLDVEEVAAMNALIRARRIKPNDLPRFLNHGLAGAPRSAAAAREGRTPPAPAMAVADGDRAMQPRGGMESAPAGAGTRAAPAAITSAEQALLRAGT